MNLKKAILIHPQRAERLAYATCLRQFQEIELLSVASKSTEDTFKALIDSPIDYVFLGDVNCDGETFLLHRETILKNHPRVKIILLGLKWFEHHHHCMLFPLRGIIDIQTQKKSEIMQALSKILSVGFDFTALVANPQFSPHIKQYLHNTPTLPDHYWAILPSICTGFSVKEIAAFHGVSRKTMHTWMSGFMQELECDTKELLMVLAYENNWVTRGSIHAAYDRINIFTNGHLLRTQPDVKP